MGAMLGALVCVLGALVLLGRHLQLPILFQFRPSWLPTYYNPALCLVALGLGLVALAGRRFRTASVTGFLAAAIGALTLATWVFDLHPGIDQIFFRHDLLVIGFAPGRMSPMTALAFTLLGVAVCLAASARRVPAFAVVAWVIGVLTCVGGLLSTLMSSLHGNRLVFESLRFVYSSPHSGLGVALAGTAITILSTTQKRSAAPQDCAWQLPVATGIAAAMVSIALWQGFAVEELQWIRADTEFHGQQIVAQLKNDGRARADLFTYLANQTSKHVMRKDEETWVTDVTDLVHEAPWLRQIDWLNPDGGVRHRIRLDRPSGPTTQTIVPISDLHGTQIGTLAITTDLRELLMQLINQPEHGYSLSFSVDSLPVYSWPARAAPGDSSLRNAFQADVAVVGRILQLSVWPGPQSLTRQQTLLPQVTLLFGLALSFLLMVVLRYATVARQRASSILAARVQIEHEIDDRRRAELAARKSEDRAQHALTEVEQILNQSQDLICTVSREGCFLVVSPSSWGILGYRPEEMMGRHWDEFVYPPDTERTQAEVAALRSGKAAREFENRAVHRSGKLVHLSWSSTWLSESGTSYSIGRDVTSRVRQDAVREGQRQILQLIAGGSPVRVVLDAICDYVEMIHPGSLCSVLMLDDDGRRLFTVAAPSLAVEFKEAVDALETGLSAESDVSAVWRERFEVVDKAGTDPFWNAIRKLAVRHGLESCWSMPITGEKGTVLGAFAVYKSEAASPEPHEIDMIEAAAGLASVAIERANAHSNLLEGKEQLDFARRIAQLGYWEDFLGSGRVVLSEDMLTTLGLPSTQDQEYGRLLEFVVEEDRSALTTARDAALKHDVPVDIEIRLKVKDGSLRYIHFRGRKVLRGDRLPVKLAGTVQDVTARKLIELENARLYAELEDRVRSRTRELEQSNRELEAFSYSVSHDLRAPLRAISGFSALLAEEYGPAIGQQGNRYMERIIAGTVRMSALIDDLLELGRVSRIELTRQPLDISALASAVSGRLHERWPERVVDIEIQRELVAWGDLRLIEVILENLLENAWKFTAGRPIGRIRVGTTEQLGEQAFFIADNGVGFDPQYAANLFGVFQRLHAASAFPGTGVGLATVQRILQRHSGRIWADAQTDRGATFYFTLS